MFTEYYCIQAWGHQLKKDVVLLEGFEMIRSLEYLSHEERLKE